MIVGSRSHKGYMSGTSLVTEDGVLFVVWEIGAQTKFLHI